MADSTRNGAAVRQAGAQGSEPDVASAQHPPKRGHRHKKNHSQSIMQVDGAVSDSVANPMTSPRSKRQPKPRQQSVAIGAPANENTKANGHKPRHASVGGNMLPATPFKEQAYAGPTFQASPEPSSLPVPKFFSRSVPNVAAPQSLEARMAGEEARGNEQSSPESDTAIPPPRASQQSPLDIFFNADKAEKERRASGDRLSPEMAAKPRPPVTEPRNPFQQTGKSVFLREMDGDEAPVINPRTAPPNSRPPLSHRTSSSSEFKTFEMDSESEREAYTKNLKDLLLSNVNETSPQHPSPRTHQRPHTSARSGENVFETPSPFQRSTSGPSTPTLATDQLNHYSLHYGNRNLSPLFKAARSDTPPRPSGLRQQELASDLSPRDNAPSQQIPPIDPNSFSRSYLDHTIRNSQPTLPSNIPVNVHQTNSTYSNPTPAYPSAPISQQGVPASSAASPRAASSGGGTSNDIKTMEDDLRRMLKLNVLSN